VSDPYLGKAPTLTRELINALLPPGSLWSPAPSGTPGGGHFDDFLDGIGDGLQAILDTMLTPIGHIRDPLSTPYLSDLEREYGISPTPGTTYFQRRAILLYRKVTRGLKGQWWVLQNAINAAGFMGVNVIPNDPSVDPTAFVAGAAQMVCGGYNAYCGYFTSGAGGSVILITFQSANYSGPILLGPGETPGAGPGFLNAGPANASYKAAGAAVAVTTIIPPTPADAYSQYILLGPGEMPGNNPGFKSQGPPNARFRGSGGQFLALSPCLAFCAQYGGTILVNGAQYQNNPAYSCVCGNSSMYCHTPFAGSFNGNICGAFIYIQKVGTQYGTPGTPNEQKLVFFVGGTPTYNGDGSLAALTQAQIPAARLAELVSLILRYKPLHSWCALIYTTV
jgi:hypothetical protein